MKPNFKPFLKKLKKAAPYILSGLSVVGVVATAVLSAKNTVKALEQADKRDDVWKCYIPTALSVIATAAVIIGNGVLNHKQQASLISAYTVLASTYKKYRDKTKETYGVEADRRIMQAIAVEKPKPIVISRPGVTAVSSLEWGVDSQETEHLFYDRFSDRYFTSTINKVLQAEMNLSYDFSLGGWVSMNDFYELLGLEKVDGGDEVGWSVCDDLYFIEFDHYTELIEDPRTDDSLEALVIDYIWPPDTQEGWDKYL